LYVRQFDFSSSLRQPAALGRPKWSGPAVREAVFVFFAFCLAFALIESFDLPPRIFEFTVAHKQFEIDDIIVASFIGMIALAIYAMRRVRELRGEIKARREAEKAAQQLARHDPLTGLPNRRYFNEQLDARLQHLAAGKRQLAVLMLDLDGFKAINDVHGHAVGDKALIEFAERLKNAAKGAVIARVGGDEFAVVLPDIASLDEPAALAGRIAQVVAGPFSIGGVETALGVGIGISIAPDNGTHADELVRRADLALYRAKADGRSLIRFFEPAMDAHVERRAIIERELRAAIAADRIEVHYQPLIDLAGSRIIGFEGLARWYSPTLGALAPTVFIPIAEESGLIHRLGDKLLRIACRDAKRWPDDYLLSFNISPMQLRDRTFGLRVLGILGETGLPPARLELEITESAIVGDPVLAQQAIDDLRGAGVRIALDDFGTGYATMSQLLSLRFDKIKIDRSFVSNLGGDSGDSEVIVRAIIGLAKGLGLITTAEGIENADQLAELKANGCVQGQGYLFGKAMPASEIAGLLRNPSIVAA
jgi:diguanylate cyclase (GGDEF)-like protein